MTNQDTEGDFQNIKKRSKKNEPKEVKKMEIKKKGERDERKGEWRPRNARRIEKEKAVKKNESKNNGVAER